MPEYLQTAANVASWALIVAGVYFIVIGAIGLIRMPDVYTRMHAASLIDSLGSGLLILGLIIQAGPTFIALKLLLIYFLLFFTSPVATHAVAQASLVAGIEPLLDEDRRKRASPSASTPTKSD